MLVMVKVKAYLEEEEEEEEEECTFIMRFLKHALSAHIIYINLNTILYTHAEDK